MLSYGLKYRKNTESKNPKVVKTKNWRMMLLLKCEVSDYKILKYRNLSKSRKLVDY